VEGVLAQRLVRMICPQCKEYRKPDNEMIVQLGSEADQIEKIASGNGCRECRFTGYWGRTCITEFMLMDRRIREMVTTKCNSDEIRVEAMKQGMQPLRQSGIHKMIKGLTTIEEVLRVTPSIESEKEVEI
jgi:type II secretory ATPase GspE/PulE/Tfp pilus assembly ATPase PilB-like protein